MEPIFKPSRCYLFIWIQPPRCNAKYTANCAMPFCKGQLDAHARLPASRQLAAELGVSRNSVLGAYEQLTAEGYLTSRPGAGTFVATVTTRAPQTSKPTAKPAAELPERAPVVIQPSRYAQRIQAEVSEELFQRKSPGTTEF